MRRVVVLLALAGCDLVFPPATRSSSELGVALVVDDVVVSEGEGMSPVDVSLDVTNPSGKVVYYRLEADQGKFARSATPVVEGQLGDHGTESWIPPYAPTKAKIAAYVSLDPFLADPTTTVHDVTVHQRVGHPVGVTESNLLVSADQIVAIEFTPSTEALVLEIGAHAIASGAIKVAIYQNAVTGAKELLAAPPAVVATDPVKPFVVPITPVSVAPNRNAWIGIMTNGSLTVHTLMNNETVAAASASFDAGFPPILSSSDSPGASLGLFATLGPPE